MSTLEHMDIERSPFALGDRVRFTGDDMRDEGDACREITGVVDRISGHYVALRDDDGNLWSVSVHWIEHVAEKGEAA
ncbi:hypothetical protein [Methylosinus sp. Sm6]|uniref:hypothetical protein n=1 Tax=Methylosinus sp. Sm6 TaxID=2866948 RepID=UPI001C99531F|nr:hypothetical protein [Methylosinus sp. Sm6]MBY6244165.1 hypothetical protein [Methylosinus sp. Sm6]